MKSRKSTEVRWCLLSQIVLEWLACIVGEQGDDTPSAQSINQPQSPNNHSSLNLRREQLSKALYGGKTGLTRPLNPLESELTLPPLAKELHDTDGPFQERKPDTEIASLSMNASSQLGFTQHEGTCESTVKSSHSSEEEIVNSIPVEQEVLLEKSLANDLQKLDLSEASLQNRLSTPLTSSPGWWALLPKSRSLHMLEVHTKLSL